jgi:hypothetical protein
MDGLRDETSSPHHWTIGVITLFYYIKETDLYYYFISQELQQYFFGANITSASWLLLSIILQKAIFFCCSFLVPVGPKNLISSTEGGRVHSGCV